MEASDPRLAVIEYYADPQHFLVGKHRARQRFLDTLEFLTYREWLEKYRKGVKEHTPFERETNWKLEFKNEVIDTISYAEHIRRFPYHV